MLNILSKYELNVDLSKVLKTVHYDSERNERDKYIQDNNLYDCSIVDTFVVDKQHKNGLELHCVTDTGLIVILNKYKYEHSIPSHVTTLIARPGQISRYYGYGNEPTGLIPKCVYNRRFYFGGESLIF